MVVNPSHRQLQLDISADSRIANVTVYPDRAEVTRVFSFQLEAGKTVVTLTGGFPYVGVPPVFSRLEKEGEVTLSDVEITEAAPSPEPESPPPQTSKPIPQTLEEEKELLEASLSRCELAPVLLDNYVKQLDLNKFSIKSLDDVLEAFDQQSHKWDKKIQELKKNIRDVENKIEGAQPSAEDVTPVQAEGPLSSNHRVQFSLEANSIVVVELRLAYYVMEASWIAEYDIIATSVHSEDEEIKLALTYKAVISNGTGEAWENVDLTLESKPPIEKNQEGSLWTLAFRNDPDVFPQILPNAIHDLASKVSIPGGMKQTVVITQLQPRVNFQRHCTPSVDLKVRVEGQITNKAEYPLRTGNANIYLDGNYYIRTRLGALAVGEVWSVPLGFDGTVHVNLTSRLSSSRPTGSMKMERRPRITIVNTRKTAEVPLSLTENFPRGGSPMYPLRSLLVPPLKGPSGLTVRLTDGIPKDTSVIARWLDLGPSQERAVNWECRVGPLQKFHLDFHWTTSGTG